VQTARQAHEQQNRGAQALSDLMATHRIQAASAHASAAARATAAGGGGGGGGGGRAVAPTASTGRRLAGIVAEAPPTGVGVAPGAWLDPAEAWEQYIAHGTDSLLHTAILSTNWHGQAAAARRQAAVVA